MITIHHLGHIAYCDTVISSYSTDAENDERTLFLVSLFGISGNVEAVSSAIIQGSCVDCFVQDKQFRLQRPFQMPTVRSSLKKLARGVIHKLIYLPCWLGQQTITGFESNQTVILAPDIDTAKRRAFGLIDRRVSIPLKPEWTDWLWDTFYKEKLFAHGGKEMSESYLVSWLEEDELADSILEAVRLKHII